jgi:hypothetical protein
MRSPSERDQCQAKLDLLVEGFAIAWLRDFAEQKNIEQGRVMCGSYWYTPREIESVRERARMRALDRGRQRRNMG